jgi:predicted AAA+ superfamily ATPase
MELKRTIEPFIQEYLTDKIVLLSGPRQVGKTFLSKRLSRNFQYLTFDSSEDREIILKKTWVRDGSLVIFDEIHKLRKWKQWIKGVFDKERGKNQFLLTGSTRLDTFRKSGDSLAGRHVSVRLNPLSVRESMAANPHEAIDRMLQLGAFPEPYLSNSPKKAAIWRRSHLDVIIKQDLMQLESVRDLVSIELLIDALRRRVGQQIVYKNIADELSVSPHTIKKWIQLLESLFVVFTVYPYTKNILDAVKKEPKIYFYDVGQVQSDEGFKLENIAALHLLKRNQYIEDTEGKQLRLAYIRDKKKREVDFAIEENGKLSHLIEIKMSDDSFNPALNYFTKRLKPTNSFHLVHNLARPKSYEVYEVQELGQYLKKLET